MSKTLKGTFIGEAMIYRKDDWGYPQYSVSLANQNQQTGEWEYTYLQVKLPSNTFINNKTEIIINKSFFSFYKTKNGDDKFKLIITDYELKNQSAGDINIPEDNTVDFDIDSPW